MSAVLNVFDELSAVLRQLEQANRVIVEQRLRIGNLEAERNEMTLPEPTVLMARLDEHMQRARLRGDRNLEMDLQDYIRTVRKCRDEHNE